MLGKINDGEDSDFDEPSEREEYRLQVYSKAPIQPEDYEVLNEYLVNDDTDLDPFLEIYSYNPPDPLACAEHQRREIAHRKRLHAESDRSRDELPPLIPAIRYRKKDCRTGFCILLTSESYQAGSFDQERNERGSGPFFIYFDPRLPWAIRQLDLTSRLSVSAHNMSTFTRRGIQVFPEARDIEVSIESSQEMIGADTMIQLTDMVRKSSGELDGGLDEPFAEGLEPAALDAQQVQELLEQQQQTAEIQPVDSCTLHLDRGLDDRALMITNSAKQECDLQYTVYAPFLAHLPDPDLPSLLETTARTFTAAVISRLPGDKTVRFEFKVPPTSSLWSIASSHASTLKPGALHTFDDGSRRERVLPLSRSDVTPSSREHYKSFFVVVDKPAFVEEPGVLFLISRTNALQDPSLIEANHGETVLETRRSAGIPETARRLAVTAVEEQQQGKRRCMRMLTNEEHRSLLSLSPEEHQALLASAPTR